VRSLLTPCRAEAAARSTGAALGAFILPVPRAGSTRFETCVVDRWRRQSGSPDLARARRGHELRGACGPESTDERAQVHGVAADGFGLDVSELASARMAAVGGDAVFAGYCRSAQDLHRPSRLARRVDRVRGEADYRVIQGPLGIW
jgi:hypothetical protein